MAGISTAGVAVSRKAGKIINYAVLLGLSLLLVFPVLYMITNSLMTSREVLQVYSALNGDGRTGSISLKFIPDQVSFIQYYNVLLKKPKFLVMFWNSIIITVPIVAGQTIVSALAAYAFSKLRFPLRNKIFFIYIIVMLMPFQVTLVPNYIILKDLNLIGSFAAVILPGIFSTFGVFLLRQYMLFIPDEYCEAAKIDGAGYFRTFIGIIIPQCKSAVASLAILVFIDNWNMVEQPIVFLKDETLHPLSIFLSRINAEDMGLAFACGILYMLPALIVFLYGENYLVEGIQLSGIK